MMKIVLIILIFPFSIFHFPLFGQHADCDKMVILKDTFFHANNIAGFGEEAEFSDNSLEDKKVFENEKNSIWYLITMPDSGEFTFDIITNNPKADWDFLLYPHKKMFCERIVEDKIPPIRSNLSRSAETGLSINSQQEFVGAGINENYSKSILVQKGEQYVLVVNNPKQRNQNHTLILHFPKKLPGVIKVVTTEPTEIKTTLVTVKVKDKNKLTPVKSNLTISGLTKKTINLKNSSEFKKEISQKNGIALINVSSEGYMLTSIEFKIGKNQPKANYNILIEPIVAGAKVNLKRIQFYGNRYDLLPSAQPSLEALLAFMQINPTVLIEIEGHVNGPGQSNSKAYKALSNNRAFAVRDYLIKNGIQQERIDFKGYGNSKMLNPNPKNEYQQSANRRVEIKILSK